MFEDCFRFLSVMIFRYTKLVLYKILRGIILFVKCFCYSTTFTNSVKMVLIFSTFIVILLYKLIQGACI